MKHVKHEACESWNMNRETWTVKDEPWTTKHETWNMKHETRNMKHVLWVQVGTPSLGFLQGVAPLKERSLGKWFFFAAAVAPRGSAARQRRAVARPLRPKTAQISAHNGSSKVPVRYGTIRYDTVRYRPIPSDTVQRNVPFRTVPYRIGIGKNNWKFLKIFQTN